ncbi:MULTISPECIES: hypothetical protein [unclassified Streptomyces]|uniref:hypothetical protein n=1 Tax=unclassified Streptomyces TaxID=2593676 RepID=UPI001660181B|nr:MULTISPECIES: hypothetical protein [unclassified Streptomyces]MBD0708189.1 hypothetical protein [Streptomyces sp. CBMA291]MBD0714501.1 hypothetical protein [Streptomyces sp. CBMA370]
MSFAIRYSLTVDVDEKKKEGSLPGAVAEAAGSLLGLGGLPLKVSNDLFGGALILDADLTVTMNEGAVAGTFDLVLVNVPGDTVDMLRGKIASTPLKATVRLGYFDEPGSGERPVMEGRVTRITSWIAEDGLTRLRLVGQDAAGFALRTMKAAEHRADSCDALEFAGKVVRAAGLHLAKGSELKADLTDYTVNNPTALAALRDLAGTVPAPVVIRDRTVYLGPAVGTDDPAPVPFHPDLNLVAYGDAQGDDTAAVAPSEERPPPLTSVNLTVLGHPDLRVGQTATIGGVDHAPKGPLRIHQVVHRFSGRGYVCEVRVVAAAPGETVEVVDGGVQTVVDRMEERSERERRARPSVDVGEVTSYRPRGHQVSLKYGQSPPPSQAAPSVTGTIGDDVLLDKPVAAPFAFGPCGLMTPVYPKMRALLAHNRNLVNDAAVVGWLWPRTPGATAPAPQPGDHWLALPTRLGTDGMPEGPGVNDLTDAKGGRIMQARGLRVVVGTPKLPPVGTRPTPPDDDSLTIEHHTGTTITVDASGAVTVSTSGRKIMLSNGTVNLALDGPSVRVT